MSRVYGWTGTDTRQAADTLPVARTPQPPHSQELMVAAIERHATAILRAHGPLHVPDAAGRLREFAREADAATQRQWAAEQRAQAELRHIAEGTWATGSTPMPT